MYIKNLNQNLTDRGFKVANPEDPCEYILRINKDLQILVVTVETDYIMLVSEHKVLEGCEGILDYNHLEILSEGVLEDEIIEFFTKYEIKGIQENNPE